MLTLFMTINMITSMLFMFMNHPMSMGLILLTQTVMISLMTGLTSLNFWFSYILFLVMIGGMLVLFIYMTSLASNEMFNLSPKLFIMVTILILLSTMLSLIMDNSMINALIKNSSTIEMNYLLSYTNDNLITLNKVYNFPINMVTILLINYLLLTLIAVVKITSIKYGPLRQKF
uniref:NADH-ubiquinone oxidoreductase chain 6 n=1 Tax=Pseudotetracha mendacia TaxID=346499 RepID=A0A343EYU4_9CARA|nr:NADH dehydrogenase subunit 6 [Pseudotetracha mendacia]